MCQQRTGQKTARVTTVHGLSEAVVGAEHCTKHGYSVHENKIQKGRSTEESYKALCGD